jgi:hypothetical protein
MELPRLDSKQLTDHAEQHKEMVKDHKMDWNTFFNGYLTCYADLMLEATEPKCKR